MLYTIGASVCERLRLVNIQGFPKLTPCSHERYGKLGPQRRCGEANERKELRILLDYGKPHELGVYRLAVVSLIGDIT